MKNVSSIFLANDLDLDEIDEIFCQLEHFEPPVDMVERIMDIASLLPLPVAKLISPWSNLEKLVVHYDYTKNF